MDEEKDGVPLLAWYFSLVKNIFVLSIASVTIAGLAAGMYMPALPRESSLFNFGSQGIAYRTVLQIGVFSIIIGAFYALLLSDRFIKKMALYWRITLLHIATIIVISIFWLICKWGPWIKTIPGLIVFYISCVAAGSLMILKVRLNDRKYNRLLSSYKERRKKENV
jgi:hypothetical protein